MSELEDSLPIRAPESERPLPVRETLAPRNPNVAEANAAQAMRPSFIDRQTGILYCEHSSDESTVDDLAQSLGVTRTLARLLAVRGVTNLDLANAYLEPRLAQLTAPDAMLDRELAADRIAHAVRAKQRIVVFGDYDVDGTTSAAILTLVLRELGADVIPMLASRFVGGYGFSDPALEQALSAGAQLIITCDCGSSDHDRITRAQNRGVDVVVIDHHLVPKQTLPAFAFLNPHRPECGFPFKGLCTAGLALSLAAALRKTCKSTIDLRNYLDLVALGTIADVAPLAGDNRVLTRVGLERLSQKDIRPGLAALKDFARLRGNVHSGDVAFRIAPRLNASGRLGDPMYTLRLLLAHSNDEARALAMVIESTNAERKRIQNAMAENALAQAQTLYGTAQPSGIVVASRGWHKGVAGIVAARLVDVYRVPAIAIAIDDNGVGHGSGRTPDGGRLYDAVHACRELTEKFGGHQAAIGITLREERVAELREAFQSACKSQGTMRAPVYFDAAIDGETWRLPNAKDLLRCEPFGFGNAEPRVVLRNVQIERADVVAEEHLRLRLRVGRDRVSSFAYQMRSQLETLQGAKHFVGTLRVDTFREVSEMAFRLEACVDDYPAEGAV